MSWRKFSKNTNCLIQQGNVAARTSRECFDDSNWSVREHPMILLFGNRHLNDNPIASKSVLKKHYFKNSKKSGDLCRG